MESPTVRLDESPAVHDTSLTRMPVIAESKYQEYEDSDEGDTFSASLSLTKCSPKKLLK